MSLLKNRRQQGFTIVELLIVIVVIAILAAITIVAYNAIQQRSRDSIRKQDLVTLAKAISLYKIDNGDYIGLASGCGLGGTGTGWVSKPVYTRSIIDCLQDGKYIQQNIVDPSGCVTSGTKTGCAAPSTNAYMKVNCTASGVDFSYLMARMENTPMSKPAELSNCGSNTWWEEYGMNYALRVS